MLASSLIHFSLCRLKSCVGRRGRWPGEATYTFIQIKCRSYICTNKRYPTIYAAELDALALRHIKINSTFPNIIILWCTTLAS